MGQPWPSCCSFDSWLAPRGRWSAWSQLRWHLRRDQLALRGALEEPKFCDQTTTVWGSYARS